MPRGTKSPGDMVPLGYPGYQITGEANFVAVYDSGSVFVAAIRTASLWLRFAQRICGYNSVLGGCKQARIVQGGLKKKFGPRVLTRV